MTSDLCRRALPHHHTPMAAVRLEAWDDKPRWCGPRA